MQITLSERDLDAMPAALRRRLLEFLLADRVGAAGAPARLVDGLLKLSRPHAINLVREASFRPEGHELLAVLRAATAGDGADGPSRQAMMKALQTPSSRSLRQHLDTLDGIAQKATGIPAGRLWRYGPKAQALRMEPSSRRILRDVLESLSHAGEQEEPLWE